MITSMLFCLALARNSSISHPSVSYNLFNAVVDYSAVDEQKKELTVSIQNIPSFLLNYEYYPRTVEFLISKK